MVLPAISKTDILSHFSQVTKIDEPIRGGQKLVFPCQVGDSYLVLKIMSSDMSTGTNPFDESRIDEVFERAKREVTILENCDCENLPKIGSIPLTRFEFADQSLIAFSEEFIAGESLEKNLEDEGQLNETETIQLGNDLCRAVYSLWKQKKIHRDIKPANIMRRRDNGQFVLLDPGIAFDLCDNSLTSPMAIAHTPGYLAPELSNPAKKRDADCRSDFFLIGTVLYLACTGRHPFLEKPPQEWTDIIHNIVNLEPPPPREVRPEVSESLSAIIMRLLAKRKHSRYRNATKLQAALAACDGSLEQ